jgi:predicted nuclease with TOPRIM domain
MQSDYKKIKDDYDNLQIEYSTLTLDREELKKKYDELVSKHETLKTEYTENVIIESMNDMKNKYERLLQTSVPNHKYTLLYEKYVRMVKYMTTSSVLLDHTYKLVRQVERLVYTNDIKSIVNKIENEINITRDILEDCLESIK